MRNAIAALNEGAYAFLLKPVEFELLSEKIGHFLKEQEEMQSLIDYAMIAMKLARKRSVLARADPPK
jgi:DNA-binding NtrC family response regulator